MDIEWSIRRRGVLRAQPSQKTLNPEEELVDGNVGTSREDICQVRERGQSPADRQGGRLKA